MGNLAGKHIWFFDGQCALCDRGVQFLLKRDTAHRFRVAQLQSEFARRELPQRGVDPAELEAGAADGRAYRTFYLLADYATDRERLYSRSHGVAFLLSQLSGGWKFLGRLGLALPMWLLDPPYRLINLVRYPWFGKLRQGAESEEKRARLIS